MVMGFGDLVFGVDGICGGERRWGAASNAARRVSGSGVEGFTGALGCCCACKREGEEGGKHI